MVPAQINLKIMLIRQTVIDGVYAWHCREDLVTHLVHGVLHAGAIIVGERLQRDIPRRLPRFVKRLLAELDFLQARERLPQPAALDFGRENAVPGFWQDRVVALVEAVKRGARALQHQQFVDAALDGDAAAGLLVARHDLHLTNFLAVAVEAVWVRLAVDDHARPAVLDDLDVCGVDVRVLVHEVLREDATEEFGG